MGSLPKSIPMAEPRPLTNVWAKWPVGVEEILLGQLVRGALSRPANEPLRGDRINLGEQGDATVKGIKIKISLKVEIHDFKEYTVGISPSTECVIGMDIMID